MGTVSVSATGARAMLTACAALGLDATLVEREAGFDPAMLADPDGLLPASQFYRGFAEAARLWGRPGFGLAAGQAVPVGFYHVLDYLLLTAATLGEGLTDFTHYFAIATRTAAYEIHHTEGLAGCEMVWRIPPGGVMFDVRDWSLSALARRVREAAGLVPARVDLAGPPVAAEEDYARVLCAPVTLHAQRNALWFSTSSWHTPLPRRDDWLRQTLRRHADLLLERGRSGVADSAADRVRRAMLRGIRVGVPPVADVARELGVGVRTLQRQLRHEGVSFAALGDEVRAQLSREYLNDQSLTIAEVGYLLGFSEPGAFTRAFKRWTGQSPKAFRSDSHPVTA